MAPRSSSQETSRSGKVARKLLSQIRLFATDVDGVLTDAGMYYAESGDEWKKFNTRDGMGIKLLQKAGIITAIVTQERTKLVARRAEKLTIPELHQGVMDKLSLVREMAARYGLTLGQVPISGTISTILRRSRRWDFPPHRPTGCHRLLRRSTISARRRVGRGRFGKSLR